MAIREVENLKSINRKQSCGNLESQTEGMDFFLAIQTWRRLLTQDYQVSNRSRATFKQ